MLYELAMLLRWIIGPMFSRLLLRALVSFASCNFIFAGTISKTPLKPATAAEYSRRSSIGSHESFMQSFSFECLFQTNPAAVFITVESMCQKRHNRQASTQIQHFNLQNYATDIVQLTFLLFWKNLESCSSVFSVHREQNLLVGYCAIRNECNLLAKCQMQLRILGLNGGSNLPSSMKQHYL